MNRTKVCHFRSKQCPVRHNSPNIHAKEMRQDGLSYATISHQLKLSKSTVQDMIKNDYEKPKKKRGPKKNLSGCKQLRFKPSIAALKEKNVKITASKLKKEANLEVSIRTVHRSLHENRYQLKNGKKTVLLNKKQKAERVRLCSESNTHR